MSLHIIETDNIIHIIKKSRGKEKENQNKNKKDFSGETGRSAGRQNSERTGTVNLRGILIAPAMPVSCSGTQFLISSGMMEKVQRFVLRTRGKMTKRQMIFWLLHFQ